jgi:uncharacterized protein (DUF1501 family)
MKRRQLLQLGSLATLSLFLPGKGRAGESGYGGPYVISLHAGGGWDPTLLCDAKTPGDYIQQNLYSAPAGLASGVQAAPITLANNGVTLDTVEGFFNDLGERFLVVNGIDTQTNNHDTGVKHVWSGKTFEELPSLAAMAAGAVAEKHNLPVAYISTGGYDVTAGLVPLTRLSGGGDLLRIARPGITNPEEPAADFRRYHSEATESRLAAARALRLGRIAEQPGTARMAHAAATFGGARTGAAGFGALAGVLPAALVEVQDAFPALGGYYDDELKGYLQAVQMALLAFKSGQAVSASLSTFGFDTHSNHDVDHTRQLGRLLLTIRYLMGQADALGLTNSLYVAVGSDFGRTPTYNAGAGKDHWNVTSMLFAGPGIQGNRVIGGTDEQLRPLPVQKDDPSVLLDYDAAGGTRILPAHIQRALRKKLGLAGGELDQKYALPVDAPLDDMLG